MKLSEKQWEKVQDLVPDGVVREDGKGRPWTDKRRVLEGILWIVKTGARWRDLPKDYPPYQTCHRRFQQWVEEGVFDEVIEALARDLQDRGGIDMSECFIDGTFSLAKKGGCLWERLNAVKAVRSWQSQTLVVLFYLSRSNLQILMKSL
jgi:transposase